MFSSFGHCCFSRVRARSFGLNLLLLRALIWEAELNGEVHALATCVGWLAGFKESSMH